MIALHPRSVTVCGDRGDRTAEARPEGVNTRASAPEDAGGVSLDFLEEHLDARGRADEFVALRSRQYSVYTPVRAM